MVKNIYQNRYAHLIDLLDRHGGQSAVAAKLDVSKQYINIVANKEPGRAKQIGNRMARKIETTFSLPIGSMDEPLGIDEAQQDEHSVEVPLLNVVVSMGSGASSPWAEEVIQQMRVSKRWIRHNTEASSFSALARVTARGDSMDPTFSDGSTLLIDTGVRRLDLDAVYVLARDEELFVKRVQRNIDGSFDIISDNPAYRVQKVDNPLKSGIIVCGRVLAALNVRKL